MYFQFKATLTVLGILLVASCSSDGSDTEDNYINSDDRNLCECYRFRHKKKDLDYDDALEKDFKFWNSKFKQFKRMDRESLENLYKAFEKGQIKIGKDSSEILGYKSRVNAEIVSNCIRMNSHANKQAQKFEEIVESGGGDFPNDNSRESWLIRTNVYKEFIREFDDGEWLNNVYLTVAAYAYEDYLKMHEFEKVKSIKDKIEEEKMRQQNEYERLNPPPLPPRPVPPPPVEEIIEIENVEEY